MRRLAVLVAAILAVAACGSDEPTGTAARGLLPASDTIEGGATTSELRLMKARWAAVRDGRDYSFVTSYYCFCYGEVETPVRVTVRGASVASVREVVSGRSRPTDHYYTIEELFDRAIARRAIDRHVRVSYSARWGHPIWLTIGTPENDAGVTYQVGDVALE